MTDQIVRKMGEKKLADLKMETKFTHFKADFAHMCLVLTQFATYRNKL